MKTASIAFYSTRSRHTHRVDTSLTNLFHTIDGIFDEVFEISEVCEISSDSFDSIDGNNAAEKRLDEAQRLINAAKELLELDVKDAKRTPSINMRNLFGASSTDENASSANTIILDGETPRKRRRISVDDMIEWRMSNGTLIWSVYLDIHNIHVKDIRFYFVVVFGNISLFCKLNRIEQGQSTSEPQPSDHHAEPSTSKWAGRK